ncbi:FAD-dependent oxidoreductase [Fusibacter sp. 3D3]|uniref:FAD-dependent oxidoreductase n=1 Tax=Fusibacter sp. 3D3 TaxID=1048380 RepID=UPI0008539C0E|nr:FAD-dependent oxidoreductase [Fusibacter sp. 3D3]GAU79392.1 NADH dehydrogenase [Fusibacter sp. 3D3]
MKVIVIGCTHAGTASILNIKKLHPETEVTVYERNNNISFLSCGIALYVAGVVKDQNGLFYASPDQLKSMGVSTNMEHDVTAIDFDLKQVTVKNLVTGEMFIDSYDKLVLTMGSWPIVPKIEGIDLEGILLSKNYDHSNVIIERAKDANHITVIGAGYIGVELVEAFEMLGKKVTLIDAMDRIMSKYLDPAFTDQAEKAFTDHGIRLALGQSVVKFEGECGKVTKVVTDQETHQTDLVILCIGFKPNTGLVADKLEMLPSGAIKIDEYMNTSREDVFAAGDCCSVIYNPTGEHCYIPLATNAVRMGTLVARNLLKPTTKYLGTQGTSGIKIYDLDIASTGMTETACDTLGIVVKSVTIKENNRPEFMPSYDEAQLKLVYDATTHRVLGGQILAHSDLTQQMNTLSVCIQNKMTIEELAFVDFFFQPHYNKPWNLLNQAALAALE